ncbi:lipase member K-like [Coccinella septempunctata]|uniref:lipase member K-like n=1 Tax=Coccinella septempunctata TaxID=41139 RepID=UPI001D074EF3|nr:lipase member K-like [Coccinella septempunctata]
MMSPLFSFWKKVFLFILFEAIEAQNFSDGNSVDPDLLLDLEQFLQKHGYPVEPHEIMTDDGYLVTIFRIPHGQNGTGVNTKPILMMHGLTGTAYNFLFNEYFNKSIATYFADHGYDVWLGNTRGNTYGRKHVKLDPNKSKFWKFSWHEIGLHDLPSIIDYILEITGRKNLYYIGHSQGGTIFYVLASLKPEYQKKFAQVSLMAPGGLMGHFNNSFFNGLAKNHRRLYRIAVNANFLELPPSWFNLTNFLTNLCIGTIMENTCKRIFITMYGEHSGEYDERIFPMLINTLTSSSVMQALHYAQNIDSGRFRQWDFGKKKNMEIYGQIEPPDYPVEKIEVPVAIYYSSSDIMAFPEDEEEMCRRLKNCIKYKMANPNWNHFNFLLSKNPIQDLYKPLMEYMETFEIS